MAVNQKPKMEEKNNSAAFLISGDTIIGDLTINGDLDFSNGTINLVRGKILGFQISGQVQIQLARIRNAL